MAEIESWYVKSAEIPGLRFRVQVLPDEELRPEQKYEDDLAHRDEIIASWERDEWRFVRCVVTPVYKGVPVPQAEESMWGTEWGAFPGSPEIDRGVFENDYPVPDMIKWVLANLRNEEDDPVFDAIDARDGQIEELIEEKGKLHQLKDALTTKEA